MAILLSIEFDGNESIFEHFTRVCGKALKDHCCKLNQTAQRLGLTPLYNYFYSEDGQWFDLKEGLKTIQGLLEQLRCEPYGVCSAERSIADLEVLEQALSAAQSQRFRFNVQSIRDQKL